MSISQADSNSGQTSNTAGESEIQWFAMSAPYRRELKAKRFLDDRMVENFIPMKQTIVEKKYGIKSRELVPAIHNLIFVHTTKEKIKSLKQGVDFLQYHTTPVNGKNIPIVVPERQMQQFIAATTAANTEIKYLHPSEIEIKKGTPVRVHGGVFDGVEGYYMKIKGKRNRTVVLLIENVTAAALTEISDGMVEILPGKKETARKPGKTEPK